ncbi:MAG: DNA-directed RNA polymerase [Thaumarchaeota archaeon]|nr:DNA-directed RNA polymerase [Nitrososphaerota archaeon]
MFQIVEIDDVVRIPPSSFGKPLSQAALEILRAKYESTINPDLGYMIYIIKTTIDPAGKIIPGDGATYHKVTFSVLAYLPKIQEIVEGEIVEITDFGAFVRIGPTDALLHLSQIMDDYLTADVKQGMITATKSRRTLKVGSKLRARITAVSLGRGASIGKIGITCRQPFLGALEWIEEELAKPAKIVEKKAERKAS